MTIHQLLTHTGGTGDIFGPEFDAHRLDLRTLQDYVNLYGNRPPPEAPGGTLPRHDARGAGRSWQNQHVIADRATAIPPRVTRKVTNFP